MPRRKINEETFSDGGLPVLCERIRYFREQRGMEQKELAARIGVSANAVSNWENGRGRPDLNLLPALSKALGAGLYELFALPAPDDFTEEERRLIGCWRDLTPGHRLAVRQLAETLRQTQNEAARRPVRRLTFYGRPLSAGPGDPTEFDGKGTPVWVYASRQTGRADCVFRVNGDSMEPRYHSGDLVLVSRIPDAPALKYGEVGAFIAGNETYIKVCEKDGLHSLNPAYAPLRFGEGTDVFLIGRVTGVLKPEDVVPEEELTKYPAGTEDA